jgi:uncharacterized protein
VTGPSGRGAGPFVVPVAELQRQVGKRLEVDRSGVVDDLVCSGSAVVDGAECRIEGVLESILGGVSVRATVSAPWEGSCRRCLAPARGTVRVAVRELFTRGGDPEETYPLADDRVDLEPLVHDAVLLELPVAPLCRDDCAGLCPTCGAELDVAPCGCEPPADPRWAALDVLRVPDRGGSPD